MTALYIERYTNFGITRQELQGGNPVIGIAQTGSDLAPCNRHFLNLSTRIRDGIRDAGGIPLEFGGPVAMVPKVHFSQFCSGKGSRP